MSVYFRSEKKRWEARVSVDSQAKRRMFLTEDEAKLTGGHG